MRFLCLDCAFIPVALPCCRMDKRRGSCVERHCCNGGGLGLVLFTVVLWALKTSPEPVLYAILLDCESNQASEEHVHKLKRASFVRGCVCWARPVNASAAWSQGGGGANAGHGDKLSGKCSSTVLLKLQSVILIEGRSYLFVVGIVSKNVIKKMYFKMSNVTPQ